MNATDLAVLSPEALAVRWREVLDDPALDDLPEGYRVELDVYGDLIVSPRPVNRHQIMASLVCDQLREALAGFASSAELSIATSIGVRIPDGFWSANAAPWATSDPAPHAPEICIEIASPSNSARWLARKAEAFVQAGASEVIVVEVDGRSARYFHADGEHATSRFVALRLPLLPDDATPSPPSRPAR